MKLITTIILATIFSTLASAKDIPRGLCQGYAESPQQKKICNNFIKNGTQLKSLQATSLYSGECYWRTRLNPHHTHWGALLFDDTSNGITMDGGFSFFSPDNPYSDLNVERAKKRFFTSPRSNEVVKSLPTHAFMDKNPGGENPVWYWIRSDASNPELIHTFIFWGHNNTAFCTLSAH